MNALKLCEPGTYDTRFGSEPGLLELETRFEAGINCGAFCTSRITAARDNAVFESAMNTQALAECCADRYAGALLGACMIYAVQDANPDDDRADLRYCYPTVEKLRGRITEIQQMVPSFQPPKFDLLESSGLSDTEQAVARVQALANGTVLVAEEDGYEMRLHVPVWLGMTDGLFQMLSAGARNALENPGEPDQPEMTDAERYYTRVQTTFALSPLLGYVMVDPFYPKNQNSAQMRFLSSIAGSAEAATREVFDLGANTQDVGKAVFQARPI